MLLLAAERLRKYYGPDPVFTAVSFEIRAGDKIGLVGPNGAGKSTLMKILAHQEEPDSGQIEAASAIRVGYLEQQPQFTAGRSVWDEAMQGLEEVRELAREVERLAQRMAETADESEHARLGEKLERSQHELLLRDGYRLDDRVRRVLSGLGFVESSFHQPVEQLSGGQLNRLLLAKLLLAEPDVMLLDEPSNHLDIDATQWLEEFLAASRCAVLIVSHDRYLLDKVTNRTLELFRGTVEAYPGNFSAYCRQKAERLEVQRRTYEKQQLEIAKMEDFVRRYHFGQRHAQAEDRRKKLERIELVDPPREIAAPPMGFPPATRTGDIVLRVERVTKAYDRPLFRDLSFDLLRGEKWGILGPNGCGKTTLLHGLLGRVEFDAGRIVLGTGVKAAFFDQRLADLADDAIVVEAVRPDHKEFVEQQRRDLLARFGITGDMVFQRVGSLSGGERNRVALARLSALDANLLILDEPTNHLDLWARGALEAALRKFDGSVVFVSHDRYFLNRVADHLLVASPTGFRLIEGNYDTYQHFLRQGLVQDHRAITDSDKNNSRAASRAGSERPTENGSVEGTKPARRRRKYPYRKVAELEADIQQMEQKIADLHSSLATPEFLRDGNRVKQAKLELEETQKLLESMYEHWEEAMELN